MQLNAKHTLLALATVGTGIALACSSGYGTSPSGPTTVNYTAALSSSNERNADGTPKNTGSNATGSAAITVRGDTLTYTVNVAGLSGAATASHIHVGAANQNGGIVTPFAIAANTSSGTLATGTVILSKIVVGQNQVSGDSLLVLMNNGNSYVNVHTSLNPGGEMRGQIVKQY